MQAILATLPGTDPAVFDGAEVGLVAAPPAPGAAATGAQLLPALRPILGRGFASIESPTRRRELASRGGRAATRRHRFTSEAARRAGVRGGVMAAAKRYHWSPERLAERLRAKGLEA